MQVGGVGPAQARLPRGRQAAAPGSARLLCKGCVFYHPSRVRPPVLPHLLPLSTHRSG